LLKRVQPIKLGAGAAGNTVIGSAHKSAPKEKSRRQL
jgi:hypothetical protein